MTQDSHPVGPFGSLITYVEATRTDDDRTFSVHYLNCLVADFDSRKEAIHSRILYFENDYTIDLNRVLDTLREEIQKLTLCESLAHCFGRYLQLYCDRLFLSLSITRSVVTLYGDETLFDKLEEVISKFFKIKKNDFSKKTLELYFYNKSTATARGQSVEIRPENRPFTEMYPFLNGETLHEYYERFHNSSSSLLLLRGPHGTGKSSFIRGMLLHLDVKALMTFDSDLIKEDSFFVSFLQGTSDYFILEDADAFLTRRDEGNTVVNKFLSLGDGIVSKPEKKIILTTNLSLDKIDEALVRPGRCFDVLDFKPLSRKQAEVVAEKRGFQLDLPEQSISLAELFNKQSYTQKKDSKTIGFMT